MTNGYIETVAVPDQVASVPEEQLSGVIRYLRQQLGMTQEELAQSFAGPAQLTHGPGRAEDR